MEEMLPDHATHGADDIAAALRAQRERAHKFISRWRGSSEHIEQQLLAQVDSAMRQISQLQQGDAPSDEEWERRKALLVEQELRVHELQGDLAKRESRLVDLQSELTRAHESLLAELVRPREQQQFVAPDFSQCEQQLAERQAQLGELVDELAARQNAAAEAQAQLATQRREFDARLAHLQTDEARLHDERQQHEVSAAQLNERALDLDQQLHHVEKLTREFDGRAGELTAREQELVASRKNLARDLRLKRAEQLVEIEKRRADHDQASAAEDAELEGQLSQFTAELARVRQQTHERSEQVDKLRQELETARVQLARREADNRELSQRIEQIVSSNHHNSSETAALGAQLAEARERAESQHAAAQVALAQSREDQEHLRSELTQARKRHEAAQDQIAKLEEQAQQLRRQVDKAGDAASSQRIKQLEQERDALVERLSDAEQVSSVSSGSAEEQDELRRRFEMALDDVRALKSQNAELEEQIARAPRGTGGGAPAGDGKMDWESQKKRMLAQLESDFDEGDAQETQDKLTVEGAIQITDGIVGLKDREIDELKRMLDEQSKSIGGVAVGAAAIAQMLDGDDLIRAEREKLEQMQNEWREKLRKAEIDISVERAKIARDRAHLEERVQTLAAQGVDIANAAGEVDDKGKKKKGSRWLTRLGLGEDEK